MITPENGLTEYRGGLLQVSDAFYMYVKLIELECRKIVNIDFLVTYAGENLLEKVFNEIINSDILASEWELLTKDISNKSLCSKLNINIIKKWTNIRINSFVKSWHTTMVISTI